MARVLYDTSMSLDGLITGPDPRRGEPLGEGGDRLHEWMVGIANFRYRHEGSGGAADASALVRDELHRRTGAVLIGRKMFDVGEEPWGDDPPFAMPVFVVTHRPRETVAKEGGTTYTFVTEGIEAAVDQARAAAGGKDVTVIGGAEVARQCLEAGLLDEVHLHVVPLLLGGGVRLFGGLSGRQERLEAVRTVEGRDVAHLSYRVVKEAPVERP